MNIIVLIFDTLRYDHIGANGNKWIKTPNLDRFAADSLVFDRSFAASYPTIPHRTDVMTGKHGAPFFPWRPLRHDRLTLPRYLGENGYCTQLIHDTPHLVNGGHNFDWPFHAWTPIRGAEVDRPWIDDEEPVPANFAKDPLFDGVEERVVNQGYWWTYSRANRERTNHEDWNVAQLFLTASKWLECNSSRSNFFLWVDCFDPHEPWDVPPEYAVMYDRSDDWDGRIDPRIHWGRNDPNLSQAAKDRVKALYAAKVTWADHWVGKFLNTLDSSPLASNTAVLITSDHGTNVGERGKFGKGFPVHEQEGHTPFMIRLPDRRKGRFDLFVQPQDVFATICNIAGLPLPEGLDSYDLIAATESGVKKIERNDKDGASGSEDPVGRRFALSGHAFTLDSLGEDSVIFTLFAEDWYLEAAVNPAKSRLVKYGETEDRASAHSGIVEELYAAGIEELRRRGTDPKLLDCIAEKGEGSLPEDCVFWDGYPGPAGFGPYFRRLYEGP
jgi:arylsulfatase A-like enzyme